MIKKIVKKIIYSLVILPSIYLCFLLFPSLLFANKFEYKQCSLYSDRPIEKNITNIIDNALSRIAKSELYDSTIHFDIYLCNDLWRFQIFTQWNKNAGAVTQYHLNNAIYIRPCDITNNKIIPPKEWYFADNPFSFADRPLVYYFAHEMTHKLQSNYTGRLNFSNPTWLTEGYADYIGKGGNFDFNENLKLLHKKAPELDPTKGLYRYYHLKIAYLLDSNKQTIKQLYKTTPNEKELEEQIWKIPLTNKE